MTARHERKAAMAFSHKPSTVAYMMRAFYPSAGLGPDTRFPPLQVRWLRQRLDTGHLAAFVELTGLDPSGPAVPLLYPHVLGFPLQMVILTHPSFPVPIWNVLQIRNHLLHHRPFEHEAELDWDTRVAGQRLLAKGAEVDLHTEVRRGGELVWESLNTFYVRGRIGGADPASPMAKPPEVGDATVASWHMPPGPGWRFAGLTGDYNGIHWWAGYARRFGFRGAFHHPPLALGQCLARLSLEASLPQRLDVWLKGPVYYGSDVRLCATFDESAVSFALRLEDDERSAILGRRAAGTDVLPLGERGDRPDCTRHVVS